MTDDCLNILHLSDLHCTRDEKRLAGDGHYWFRPKFREFLDKLRKSCKKLPKGGVADIIVFTGDFVHKHDTTSFATAKEFIHEAIKQIGDNATEVFVCPGNHDYDRDKFDKQDVWESRHAYREFAKELTPESIRWEDIASIKERLSLVRPLSPLEEIIRFFPAEGRQVGILSLDCTAPLVLPKKLRHGPTPPMEDDDSWSALANAISAHIADRTKTHPLLVLSHYPYATPPSVKKYTGYRTEDHEAPFLADLLAPLTKERKSGTILFAGDVHSASYLPFPLDSNGTNIFQSIAGRLYAARAQDPVFKRWWISVRLLSVRLNGSRKFSKSNICSNRLDFHPEGEVFDPEKGEWSCSIEGRARMPTWAKNAKAKSPKKKPQPPETAPQPSDSLAQEESALLRYLGNSSPEDFPDRPPNVVSLRRISCMGEYDRLIDLDFGAIMNCVEVKEDSINRLVEMITDQNNVDGWFFVGLDGWGHTLASRIGLRTGCRSAVFSIRGLDKPELEDEFKVLAGILDYEKPKHIAIVSHVVSTGQTVSTMVERLRSHCRDFSMVGLVRSSFSHQEGIGLGDLQSYFVVDQFKMHIVRKAELPSILVLPDSG